MASELSFGWEPAAVLFDEPNLDELLQEHWKELAVHKDEMPLDPAFDLMLQWENEGRFKIWAARTQNRLLVGYIAFFVQPHCHYRTTLHAVEDLYLLSKPYRRGLNGYRMFTTAIAALEELGVKRILLHSKVHKDVSKLFERLGFVNTDLYWSKFIGAGG